MDISECFRSEGVPGSSSPRISPTKNIQRSRLRAAVRGNKGEENSIKLSTVDHGPPQDKQASKSHLYRPVHGLQHRVDRLDGHPVLMPG